MSSGNSSHRIIVGIDDSPRPQVAVRWAARDAELQKIPSDARARGVAAGWGCHCRHGRAAMAAGSQAYPDRRHSRWLNRLRCAGPRVSEIVPAAAIPRWSTCQRRRSADESWLSLGSGRWPEPGCSSVSSDLLPPPSNRSDHPRRIHPQQAPVLVGVDAARRRRSWRPVAFDEASRRTWTPGGAAWSDRVSGSSPESIGRLSRWPRCWPAIWRVGGNGIPT